MSTTISQSSLGHRSQLVARQFLANARSLSRNKQAVFFTLAQPVLFLVIMGSVFEHHNVAVPGGRINEPVYYVQGIMAYGIIGASFSNLVVTVVRCRESGIYKRRRATPMPASAFIAADSLVATASALAIAAVIVVIGWLAFSARIPDRTIEVFVLDVVIGAMVFCCLGFATASFIKNVEATQPVVYAIVLPLCFISGVFIPIGELPPWLVNIGKVFPVHALAAALLHVYNTHSSGSGLSWSDLAVLGTWGVVGLAVALRRFRWLPQID